MSDVVVTPEAAPIVVDPTAAKPAATPVPAKVPEDEKPSWLDARLERERAKILKDIGAESVDGVKKALADLRAKEDAEKTAAQKAAELETSLKTTKAEKEAMAEALGAYAKTRLGALSEAQRNAVQAVAGDDPAKQLKTIEALSPTWASAAAPAAPTAQAAPKDTAPAPSAPKDSGNASPPDPKAVYDELAKTNPILAARYRAHNSLYEDK